MTTLAKARSAASALCLTSLCLTVLAGCGGGGGDDGPKVTPPVLHTLSVGGAGSGTLVSSPTGISCTLTNGATSGTCSASFAQGSAVSMSGTPASDWELVTWTGGCSGAGSCQVTMSSAQTVGATFDRAGGPGLMKLSVTAAAPSTGGLLLTITGGTVSSVTGLGALQVRTIVAGAQTRVFLRGSVGVGAVADLQVADRKSNFSVTVQSAAAGSAGGYAVLSPSAYQLAVVRP